MKLQEFIVGKKKIGAKESSLVIAEVAQAHDGSLRVAHSYIDAVVNTGADCIKFQMHLPEYESTLDEPFRINMGSQDHNRYEYWDRTGFSVSQWAEIIEHATSCGLAFLCSGFSVSAIEILRDLGVSAWKLPSGEIESFELIDSMGQDKLPILISTGLASYKLINNIVEKVRSVNSPYALFQCTSRYPTPITDTGLNVMEELKRYGGPVGLSDHSGSILPSLLAISRGASLIEVHIAFDKRIDGPDVESSITVDELRMLCEGRDVFHKIDQNIVDKDSVAESLSNVREIFSKSLALTEFQNAGTRLTEDMIGLKKPGGGIKRQDAARVVGRILRHNKEPNRLLDWTDFE